MRLVKLRTEAIAQWVFYFNKTEKPVMLIVSRGKFYFLKTKITSEENVEESKSSDSINTF